MTPLRRPEPLPCYDDLFDATDGYSSEVKLIVANVRDAPPDESEASEHPTLPIARHESTVLSRGDALLTLGLADLAHAAIRSCRTTRSDVSELGPLGQVPHLTSSASDLGLDGIDHRDAFILGLIDGEATLGSIVAESSLPVEQVLGVLAEFVTDGRITLAAHRQR